jgi:hypothetical protein
MLLPTKAAAVNGLRLETKLRAKYRRLHEAAPIETGAEGIQAGSFIVA